jgi:hypothetical protein
MWSVHMSTNYCELYSHLFTRLLSEGTWFESLPGYQHLWLQFFMIFSHCPFECSDSFSKQIMTTFFQIYTYSLLMFIFLSHLFCIVLLNVRFWILSYRTVNIIAPKHPFRPPTNHGCFPPYCHHLVNFHPVSLWGITNSIEQSPSWEANSP